MKSDYETALDMMTEIIGQMRRMPEPKNDGLGSETALKEQVRKLVEDKRKLAQSLDHVIEENNDLELTIGRLKAALENAQDENETLLAKVVSYERTSTEASKEIDRLTAKLKVRDEENDRLFTDNNDLRKKLDKLAAENDELEEANRKFAFDIVELDMKIKKQADALAIYRVPVPRDCPFCGGPAEVHQLRKDEWYVACGNSDCPVNPETSCFDTETDAIEAWNNSYNAPKVTCDWR